MVFLNWEGHNVVSISSAMKRLAAGCETWNKKKMSSKPCKIPSKEHLHHKNDQEWIQNGLYFYFFKGSQLNNILGLVWWYFTIFECWAMNLQQFGLHIAPKWIFNLLKTPKKTIGRIQIMLFWNSYFLANWSVFLVNLCNLINTFKRLRVNFNFF